MTQTAENEIVLDLFKECDALLQEIGRASCRERVYRAV
jgi:hypothetical protein